MYSQIKNMCSTISVDDLAALSWALLIAKHANEQMQFSLRSKEEDSLDREILRDEHELFEAAEEIVRRIWANARVEVDRWQD